MILVTRLDNSKLLVNLDNVKYIESTPDTLIRFMNGDSLMVLESLEEVQNRALFAMQKFMTDTHKQPQNFQPEVL
ncbi:MAG: flagellar FlbD family protein [Oligoflexales bacterium]